MPQGSNEGANSPLSPVSGAPTEVPTDCGRDDASREGDLAEEPTLVPELPATLPDSLLASGSWGAEQEALAKKQRLLLDRAYRYLVLAPWKQLWPTRPTQVALRMALKDDAAPAAATPPDQGSAMELELSQALIELRRLTLFQGSALREAIPRYFTEEQLRELMARLEDAQLYMRDLREENPAAATRASSPKGRAWLARGTSPRRMLEQRVLRATSWKDFTEEEVAGMSAAMRHSLTSRLAAKARAEAEALAAEVSRRKKAEHQAKQITAAMEEAKKAEELRRYEADLAKATKGVARHS